MASLFFITHFLPCSTHPLGQKNSPVWCSQFAFSVQLQITLMWASCWRFTASLKGLLMLTSRGWILLVQPGGTLTNSVLRCNYARQFLRYQSAGRHGHATKIFPVDEALWGFVNILAHSLATHSLIIASSHHAFSWNITRTLESHPSLSVLEVLFPSPRNITVGWTHLPSANTALSKPVSCTCRPNVFWPSTIVHLTII